MSLPEPLTTAECDCTDLDGFMLNVERLMASELVALSTHEEIAAALFLWCRAWKQRPAASLPDDERVIAAFARLPVQRFRKMRDKVMRGFVQCSDGRWYHRVLAAEAAKAYARKARFHERRNGDAERLRKWRMSQSETRFETPPETMVETQSETRFVREGQGQGQGQGQEEVSEKPSSLRSDVKKRRTTLPDDFPGTDEKAWATEFWLWKQRGDLAYSIDEPAKFRDHHTARGTLAANWPATWRTWVRNAMRFNKQQGSDDGNTRQTTGQQAFFRGAAAALEELEQRDQRGREEGDHGPPGRVVAVLSASPAQRVPGEAQADDFRGRSDRLFA